MPEFAALRASAVQFIVDDEAQSLVEFAVILSALTVIAVVGFSAVSNNATSSVTHNENAMTSAAVTPP